MDFQEVIDDYKAHTRLRVCEGESYLIFPFFHCREDDSVPLRFFERDGESYLSDCGSTFEHLDNCYVEIESKREQIERVKKRFRLTEEKGELLMRFSSEQTVVMEMQLGYFIQAISVIGNIDLF